MSKSRSGRKKPVPSPSPKRASGRPVSILAVVALVVGGILLGLFINSLRQDGQRPAPSVTSRSQESSQLDGELAKEGRAAMARWCPRLAGLPSDESGLPEALAAELVTMECLELMCEHPETLAAVRT